MRKPFLILSTVAGIALLGAMPAQSRQTPAEVADALLAADRDFAERAARTDFVAAVVAMMADDATIPVPGVGFADGRAAIREALLRDTLNVTSHAAWAPVRAGVSADGMHGFTFGYIEVTRADGTVVPGKYLAYWVKGTNGWRVMAYRRGRRAAGEPARAMIAPALPAAAVAASTDARVIEAHRELLASAERAFSSEAQVLGLGPAFEKCGSADAVNMGGPDATSFVMGNVAIGRSVGAGNAPGTSPVTWAPDHRVVVASSGDLGVTFGLIVPKPAAGQAASPGIPFFTVWRKASPSAPWRYVAE